MKSDFERIKKDRITRIGMCELCNSKRNLELHHCIPKSCGGTDSEDNLVLICSKCHAVLTPKSELTKNGMVKVQGFKCLQDPSYVAYKLLMHMEKGFRHRSFSDSVDAYHHIVDCLTKIACGVNYENYFEDDE